MLEDNRSAIAAAYAQDLGWKPEEVYLLVCFDHTNHHKRYS